MEQAPEGFLDWSEEMCPGTWSSHRTPRDALLVHVVIRQNDRDIMDPRPTPGNSDVEGIVLDCESLLTQDHPVMSKTLSKRANLGVLVRDARNRMDQVQELCHS